LGKFSEEIIGGIKMKRNEKGQFVIKSVSDAIKCILLWDISNGKTLCEKCHRHSRQAGGEYNGKNF
jgi:hypothetical protein